MVVSGGQPVALDVTVRPAGASGMLPQVEGLPEMGYANVEGDTLDEQLARLEGLFGRINRDERGYFTFAQRDGGVVAFIGFSRLPSTPLQRGLHEEQALAMGTILAADFRTLTRVKEMLMGRKSALDDGPQPAVAPAVPAPEWAWNELFACHTARTPHGVFSLYPPKLGGSRAWSLWVDDHHVDDFSSEAGAQAAATPLGAAKGRAKAAVAAAAWALQSAQPRVAVGSMLSDGQRAWALCRVAGSPDTVEVALAYAEVGEGMAIDLKKRLLDHASARVDAIVARLPGPDAPGPGGAPPGGGFAAR